MFFLDATVSEAVSVECEITAVKTEGKKQKDEKMKTLTAACCSKVSMYVLSEWVGGGVM